MAPVRVPVRTLIAPGGSASAARSVTSRRIQGHGQAHKENGSCAPMLSPCQHNPQPPRGQASLALSGIGSDIYSILHAPEEASPTRRNLPFAHGGRSADFTLSAVRRSASPAGLAPTS